ncbi:hypothetical protein [Streptomyces sp. DSS69]|uniref:hypothetical protein n=1 Tax=Streptomyces sp. DSS69 TaxID=3113369 RepID=UPI0031F804D8
MSETRTETNTPRTPGGDAEVTGGSGKHRGGASMENTSVQPHGRHRRPAQEKARAA